MGAENASDAAPVHAFSPGQRHKEYLERFGVRHDRIFFSPHCVDNEFFAKSAELGRAYALADCLVLPSDYGETWALVVNEAMATGLPCVASDAVGCGPDLMLRVGQATHILLATFERSRAPFESLRAFFVMDTIVFPLARNMLPATPLKRQPRVCYQLVAQLRQFGARAGRFSAKVLAGHRVPHREGL